MFFLYSFIYSLLFIIAVPFYSIVRMFKKKAALKIWKRMGFGLNNIGKGLVRPIWIHSVSVGEVYAARPLVERLLKDYLEIPIVISVTTKTGRSTALKTFGSSIKIINFPFDFRFSVRRYLDALKPAAVIVMETELWPRFCLEVKKRDIPLILVNGRLSDTSYPMYRKIKFLMKRVLSCFSGIIVQTEEYKSRFIKIGAESSKVTVVSSLKYHFSNFAVDEKKRAEYKRILRIKPSDIIFTAGSTHKGEEDILLSVFGRLKAKHHNLKLAVVPRRPERFDEVERIAKNHSFKYHRLTSFKDKQAWEVLLVDRMGELKTFYSLSRLVFVGGSIYPHGGQNLLEPAAFSVPVLFGPHYSNFREMGELLLEAGGGMIVRNENDLYEAMDALISDNKKSGKMGRAAYSVLQEKQDGLDKVMSILKYYLSAAEERKN